MPTIEFEFSQAGKFDTRKVGIRVLNALMRWEKVVENHMKDITDPWEHTVEWTRERGYSGGSPWFRVSTTDRIFGWLDEGTKVRRAVLSPNYRSVTSRHQLYSDPKPDDNYVLKRGYGINLPGIYARDWTAFVEDMYWDDFVNDIADAIIEGMEA